MAEQTEILNLTIDIDKAVADTAAYQKKVADLKKNLDDLKNSQDATTEEIIKANAEYKVAQNQLRANEKILTQLTQAEQEEAGTLEQLTAKNADLRAERQKLNLETDAGKKRLKEINDELDKNNAFIKENSDKQKQQSLNVGNYQEDIEAATKSTNLFGGALQGNTASLTEMATAEGGVGALFSTLKTGLVSATKAGLTFIATPIGAVITAIVLGIGLITKAITGNQNQADSWGKAWAGVSEILGYFSGMLTKIGNAMINWGKSIESPKQALIDLGDFIYNQFMNRIKALGVLFDGIVKLMKGDLKDGAKTLFNGFAQLGTGVENMSDKLSTLGGEMDEAYKRGMKLKDMQIELEKAQISSIKTMQDLANEQAKYQAMADDSTLSLKQQEAANRQLTEVNKKLSAERIALLEQELKIQEQTTSNMMANNGSVSREQEKALEEAKAALSAAQNEQTQIIYEANQKQREIRKDALNRELDFLIDGFDSIKTYNEKIISNEQESVDKRVKMQEDLKNAATSNFEEQIKAVEKYYKIRIDGDALLAENDAKALNETVANFNLADDISGRILEIIKERRMQLSDFAETDTALTEAQALAAIESLNKELEAYKNANQSKLSESKGLTAEMVKAEEERIKAISDKSISIYQTQYEQNLITLQQFEDNRLTIINESNAQIAEVNAAWEDQQYNDKITAAQMMYDAEMELAQDNLFAQLDLEKQVMKQREIDEMALIEKLAINEEDKKKLSLKVADKYAKAEIAIEKAKTQAKLSLAADFAGNIATIAGEGTEIGKAAAVAQTTISTYQAATGAYASLASIPYVGPVLGAAAAAAAVVSGLANVKQILAVSTDMTGGASGGGAATTSSPTATPALSLPTASSPSIGQGIVSREMSNDSASVIKQGFAEALQENPLQPTLVVDSVTAAQNTQTNNARTATI
jgi:hypothetical protein